MFLRSRPLVPLLLALTGVLAIAPASAPAVAAFFQSNIPIIQVPDTTTPDGGIGGTVQTPTEPDPEPGPIDVNDPNDATGSDQPPLLASTNAALLRGDKLYLYVVLRDRFKNGAKPEKTMPGVVGRPWKPITKKDKHAFRFALSSVAAGSEYYVVAVQKVDGKFKYLTRQAIRVNRSTQ
jgi:hypothetical protein